MTDPSTAARVSETAPLEREFSISSDNHEILAKHAINLRDGRLIPSGALSTTIENVETLFRETLVHAYHEARSHHRPFQLLFFAHGGTVTEKSAVEQALAHIPRWLEAGIYPVFFIWETSVKNAIRDAIIGRPKDRGFGDFFGGLKDKVIDGTDWSVEKLARLAGGEQVWGEMKKYAARGVEPQRGGAWLVARELAGFLTHEGIDAAQVHVNCIGHSAGAVFHSWFVPALLAAGLPAIENLCFLAPACSVNLFKRQLLPHIGHGIRKFTTFTMDEKTELADTVGKPYRKSLLYLISRALEPEVPTPILGLEESIRADMDLRALYHYPKGDGPHADLVFSPNTEGKDSDHATRSIHHGGFGNEPYTLNSIVHRITGDRHLSPFPEDFKDQLEELDADPAERSAPAFAPSSTPRRRALCIGIDDYPAAPLDGCVNDARLWQETFEKLGFQTAGLLVNEQASFEGILHAMEDMILASRPGDALVIQYAGHGTQLPDLDGDEAEQSQGDDLDEAIVPHDYENGRFIIDDDLARVFDKLPKGVGLTCFMDCCHSGGNTRLFSGSPGSASSAEKARYLRIESKDRILTAFRSHRRSMPSGSVRIPENMREVAFAACQPEQTAKEKDGHGYFTLTATRLLTSASTATNEDFLRLVVDGFPLKPNSQKPYLHCPDACLGLPLFAIAPAAAARREDEDPVPLLSTGIAAVPVADARLLIETMHTYMENLRILLSR